MTTTPPAHTGRRAFRQQPGTGAGQDPWAAVRARGMKAAPSYTSHQDASHVRFARSGSSARGRPGRFGPGPTPSHEGYSVLAAKACLPGVPTGMPFTDSYSHVIAKEEGPRISTCPEDSIPIGTRTPATRA